MRDVGGMAEARFQEWAAEAGLVCNRATVDKGGWDYLLQFTAVNPGGKQIVSLDQLPPGASCLVQVKASDTLEAPDVKLSNWRLLANPAMPAFFLVLNYGGCSDPRDAFLIHVGEEQIGRLLKRLRELSPEERDSLHKHTMSVTWTDADRLPELNGPALRAALERHIGLNPIDYQKKKRAWWESSGYEEGRIKMSIVTGPVGERSALEQLAEFAIGRLEELPTTLTALDEERFNIRKAVGPDLPREVTLKLEKLRPVTTAKLQIYSDGNRRTAFETNLFASRAIFPFLEGEFDRCRFTNELFELVISAQGRVEVEMFGLKPYDERPLSELVNLAELMLMLEETKLNPSAILRLRATIEGQSLDIHRRGAIEGFPLDSRALMFAGAASDAGRLARTLNIDDQLLASPAALVHQRRQIECCRILVGNDRKAIQIKGTVPKDTPEDGEFAYPFVAGAAIGKTLVIVAAAVHGRGNFAPAAEPDLKQVSLLEPAIHVVDSKVILGGSENRLSLPPYYEKIEEWVAAKGFTLLPSETAGEEES